jgi:farnesyl diphosphate synthase
MTFENKLERAARLTEDRLRLELAGLSAVPQRLVEAMAHATLAGGKRLRPFLVIETAQLFDVDTASAVTVAAALESLHCYSLVHDDLPAMDNDTLRRGRPTVWAAFDEWTAILAGDGLLTMTFGMLAGSPLICDAEVKLALVGALAEAAGAAGMVGGQYLDLAAERRKEPPQPRAADIRHLQALKTGRLIRFACEAGAVLGRASPPDQARLRRFGECLGFAFQIADDLLDATGDAGTVGKAVAKDASAGKATLVSLLGIEAARSEMIAVEAEAISTLDAFGSRADGLREAARFVSQRRH